MQVPTCSSLSGLACEQRTPPHFGFAPSVCVAKTIVIERFVAKVLRTCPSLLLVHISTVRVCLGWMTSAGLGVGGATGLMLVLWQLLLG